MANQVDMNSQN